MTAEELRQKLADNLAEVERRLAAACGRSGRDRSEVTLVAVTKYVSHFIAAMLHDLGMIDLGESRPQELWRKAAALPPTVHWHLIGHLQRNKIERTLPLTYLIHSIDSDRLIEALAKECDHKQRSVDLLIEVNLSGEAAKTGMDPRQLSTAMDAIKKHPRLHCQGLMTMAAHDGPEACRATFAALRSLAATWQLPILSMGMSNDFEIAIEEGATHVRLGSVLFQGIPEEALRGD